MLLKFTVIRKLMLVLWILCILENVPDVKSHRILCKDISIAAKVRKLNHFRNSPQFRDLLIYNIPDIKQRFLRKRNLKKSPSNIAYTYQNKGCKGKRYGDEKSPCGKRKLMIYKKYNFPSQLHEYKCCKRNGNLSYYCNSVKMPKQVLRLTNPREKTKICKYVWYLEYITVGCAYRKYTPGDVYGNKQGPE